MLNGGKQRGGAVPFVIVCLAFRQSGPQREDGGCAIQRLDLTFLIDAQNQSAVGRIQV
jgi:hypothetical protein